MRIASQRIREYRATGINAAARLAPNARFVNGELVTLDEQDRFLWNREAISEGLTLLEKALPLGPVGPYQVQAAIAALHSQAATAEKTDWQQISALYEKLLDLNPSPIIALNHAVAIALSEGLEQGLERIDNLSSAGALASYYLLHAARADLLRRLNRDAEAAEAYRLAAKLATNRVEQNFLERRLSSLMAKPSVI